MTTLATAPQPVKESYYDAIALPPRQDNLAQSLLDSLLDFQRESPQNAAGGSGVWTAREVNILLTMIHRGLAQYGSLSESSQIIVSSDEVRIVADDTTEVSFNKAEALTLATAVLQGSPKYGLTVLFKTPEAPVGADGRPQAVSRGFLLTSTRIKGEFTVE